MSKLYNVSGNFLIKIIITGVFLFAFGVTLAQCPTGVVVATTPTTSNLYLSYPFTGGSYTDVSTTPTPPARNTGLPQGAPSLTTDRYGIANNAYSFSGSNFVATTNGYAASSIGDVSFAVWFKTTSALGGVLIGAGNSQTTSSSSQDKMLFMNNAGQLVFGLNVSAKSISSPAAYNNGAWHHAAVILSSTAGSKLYVDGVLVASDATMTVGYPYGSGITLYWHIGNENPNPWRTANPTTNNYFTGSLDDVVIYNIAIPASTVYLRYGAGSAPVCAGSPLALQANTVASATYAWTGPGGFTSSARTPTVTATAAAANAGVYSVTVTVGSNCTTIPVTAVVNPLPVSTFTASSPVITGSNSTITYSGTVSATSTYTWNFNGGTVASGTGAGPYTVNWASSGVKNVSLTVTDNTTGCATTTTVPVTVTASSTFGNYAYNKTLTLNSKAIGMSADQTNFPALVYIQDNALKATGACVEKVQFPNGPAYDIAFTDASSTTELNYQIESYDKTNGILLVWVKVPVLSASANTSINLYFGSKTAPAAHTAAFYKATWPADYQVVYHFNEAAYTGATGGILDGTGNNNNGTTSGMSATDLVTGKIGTAYSFAGSGTTGKLIVAGPTAAVGNTFTISAWIKLSAINLDQKIMTNQDHFAYVGYYLGIYTNNINEVENDYYDATRYGSPTGPVLGNGANEWHYVEGVYAGTTLSSYVDGVRWETETVSTYTDVSNSPLVIGGALPDSYYYYTDWFNGIIDEPRVSTIAKTDDWIKAEYFNQNNPSTFTTSSSLGINLTYAAAMPGLAYTWTGGTSTDVTNANNWNNTTAGISNQAPNNFGTIIIPTGLSQYPVLTGAFSVYGIAVASGANINLNGNNLNVACNINTGGGGIINYGNNTASTITWNGSIPLQTFTGSASAVSQTGNMTINNTATSGQVKITGGPVDLYNTLTLTSGSLVVDNAGSGALNLKSSGTFTARVAEITSTTRTITGNVTVERWFTGGDIANRGWRLMSSPVNNTGTVPSSASATYNFSSLKTNLNVTGTGGATNGFDASATNGPTILLYNTATKLLSSPAAITTANNIGSGFYFYFRGSRTGTNKLIKSGGVYPTPEVNVIGLQTGALNQQSFSYTLSNANAGFNQVGNPYPSSILMPSGSASTTLVGTTNTVYTYLSSSNSIIAQLSAVTIASGQGFYVKSNNATSSINFTESLKTANQPTGASLLLGKPVGTQTPMISLKMVQDSANYDITYLRFLDTYKKEYDEMEDADDLNGPAQNVFFGAMTSDKYLVAIASQPIEKQKTSVFLSVNDNFSGTYSIEKTALTGIPEVYDIWLMDHFKNDSLDLRANSVYKFNLDKTNPQAYGNSRFEVILRKKALPPYRLISFKGQKVADDILLKWNTLNEYDYTSFEVQKSIDGVNFEAVRNMQSSSQGVYTFKDIYNDKATANIYYRLKQTDINDNVSYSDIIIISTLGNGSFSIFPNPATNVIQYRLKDETRGSVLLRIFNTTGIIVRSGTFSTSTGQQDISSLTPGSYTIEITDLHNKKVILTSKFAKI